MSEQKICPGCGHPLHQHFKNVLDEVRCVVTEHHVSTGGICGLPYEIVCDCVNYASEQANRKQQEAKEAARRNEELADEALQSVLNAARYLSSLSNTLLKGNP